ncbi:MAG: hypothetical protein HZA34_04985 [Candidatus Pacebacteria bacterium]|nr:hypothetical protein [Candidatus Paceibacterota bacterium]
MTAPDTVTAFSLKDKQYLPLETDAQTEITDFLEKWKRYFRLAKEAHGSRQIYLRFGPTYYAQSSGGVDVEIKTQFITFDSRVVAYALYARSTNGEIIGFRNSTFSEFWECFGYIYAAVRGKGLSTALDSAHLDFLQRLSNEYRQPITWIVLNANNAKMNDALDKAKRNPTNENLSLLQKAIAEQQRWQKMWGTQGKLEIPENGPKIIQAQISRRTSKIFVERVESIENIYMRRIDGGVHVPSEIERALSPQEIEELRNKRIREFLATFGEI